MSKETELLSVHTNKVGGGMYTYVETKNPVNWLGKSISWTELKIYIFSVLNIYI